MYVATFLCNPLEPILNDDIISKYFTILGGDALVWLNSGIAADVKIPAMPTEFKKVWKELQTRNIDLVVQIERERRKKILIADLDSTIIKQESLDELADEADCGSQIREITRMAMGGDLEFEESLRRRVKYLAGVPKDTINKVIDQRICLAAGAKTLISTLKRYGVYTALVSGGFTHFSSKIASELGFDEYHANELILKNKKLTGAVKHPILDETAKVRIMIALSKKFDLPLDRFIAVGDGANDIGMLQLAGSGIAMHAKEIVQSKSKIIINHADLSGLLYLQGYHSADFIDYKSVI